MTCISRPAAQLESVEVGVTAITLWVGAIVENVQQFWEHLTSSHLASRSPTPMAVLKKLHIVLVLFALLEFMLVWTWGLMWKGQVELFVNEWDWWALHGLVFAVGMAIITNILCNMSCLCFPLS